MTNNKSNQSEQFHLYSLPASAFFSNDENDKEYVLNKLREESRGAKKQFEKSDENNEDSIVSDAVFIDQQIDEAKAALKEEISSHKGIRSLREEFLTVEVRDHNGLLTGTRKPLKHNIISMFPSILSRTLGIELDKLTMDIMIFESSYTEVLESMIKQGFMYCDEKYIFFTASAGQIRTSKAVMIKEKVFNKYRDALMCGLSVDRINESEHKGVNMNKFLAYLALSQSSSKPWDDFDIDKAIVVDDFETMVNGEVDFIDHETYDITRKFMDVPISHTDGCGMILPSENAINFQFRMPWFKGLMAVAPFDEFLKSHKDASPKVIDIWNEPWNIIKDDIRIIFTKSQFKMWKYYDSWKDYKDNFKAYGCSAGICSEDEDRGNAKLGYQTLGSLTDITDEELLHIASKTIEDINLAGSDLDTMLKILGVGEGSQSPIQQALELVPELVADDYSKGNIKDARLSMIKQARYGKVEIDAKYTFIIPDVYAFMEKLFMKIDKPKGLLSDGEVFCNLYPNNDRLLCLRSPHLYREHGIRNNMVDENRSKWFVTDGLYTSSHDLISKLLMFDCDGDDSLVVADEKIIGLAERNMKNDDIVPLYYKMATSEAKIISNDSIYDGLLMAFKGNIGKYSNAISKVWNSENPDLELIKILCMENNFQIDQAKTLFMPTRPKHINDRIKKAIGGKLPHFFKYAKDKKASEVEPINNSTVNRLMAIIPDKNIRFNEVVGTLDINILMSNIRRKKDKALEQKIIEQYKLCLKEKLKQTSRKGTNLKLINKEIKRGMSEVCKDTGHIVDVLIPYLYKEKKSKIILWECYGKQVVRHIKSNKGIGICADCKEDFMIEKQRQCRCNGCQTLNDKKLDTERKRAKRRIEMSG
ncbi:RNA dependent RNA polymerase [Cohnella sp. WQ 127256]|uniref:RNA dependent RNA polymerase n=1 Tax=Cohnella sp. WQ 127256 TaxID=2938790 RepID=UPI00211838F8|nr:RNA dependent RNA polymerase [Cohnella sp. WQ 127256]